jgi:hypothetical protein
MDISVARKTSHDIRYAKFWLKIIEKTLDKNIQALYIDDKG